MDCGVKSLVAGTHADLFRMNAENLTAAASASPRYSVFTMSCSRVAFSSMPEKLITYATAIPTTSRAVVLPGRCGYKVVGAVVVGAGVTNKPAKEDKRLNRYPFYVH